MQHLANVAATAQILAVLAGNALAQTSSPAAPTPSSVPLQAVQAEWNLRDASVQALAPVLEEDGAFRAAVALDGQVVTLDLRPHSVRTKDFQLLVQDATGAVTRRPAGEVRTLRGSVPGMPGAVVAGSLTDAGITAVVRVRADLQYWIEPLAGRVAGAAPLSDHVVYRGDQVLPSAGQCGSHTDPLHPDRVPALPSAPLGPPTEGVADVYRAQLACDADFEYFSDYGTVAAVQDRIELVINTVNLQYETETDITHGISVILVRIAEPDPYTSNAQDTLICDLITEWTTNRQGLAWDVVQLFTGKDIAGSNIGLATNFGQICDRFGFCVAGPSLDNGAFCYAQSDFDPSFACATDLSAHELGHLWDAVHCTCPSNTMNPTITCANTFSSATRSAIVSHRNTRTCLDDLMNDIWVDFAHAGTELGTAAFPYNTLAEGLDTVAPAGTVHVESGSSGETPTIDQAVTLQAENGTVVIGN